MRFLVFDNGKLVDKFVLCGAYLAGTDGIAIRKPQIAFKDGIISCEKPNHEAASLTLLWSVEGFGSVLLSTTCLPERENPYILNVEIARAKMMQILNKSEDWSFSTEEEQQKNLIKHAQSLLIKAIQNISDSQKASLFADESLKEALVFSEWMAEKQAEMLFQSRYENQGFPRVCLGCKIDPRQIENPRYMQKLTDVFGLIGIPVNWGQIEVKKGEYNFALVDKCANILSRKKVTIGAAPLLFFAKDFLPKWLLEEKSFEVIRDSAYEFILKMVERYQDTVRAWSVIRGINAYNYFGFNFEQVLEITRAANMAAKAASERALKIIDIINPWGEYYSNLTETIPPMVYIDMVVQSGINFDGFGIQMCFGRNQDGMHVRDLLEISGMLDQFVLLGRPLYIANVSVPGKSGTQTYDGKVAGIWHDRWNEQTQQQWVEKFYKIALSKQNVDTVIYSTLADSKENSAINNGLLNNEQEPKKSYETLKKLHDSIFTR